MNVTVQTLALVGTAALVLTGCGNDASTVTACKTAMSTSTTGPAQWAMDPTTRPDACKSLDEETFNQAVTEWYQAEF